MSVPAGPWHIDDLLTFTVVTHKVDTGVLTDADSVPSYRVYEDETGTAILTGSMAKLDDANTTGFYSEQLTLSAANGFENGKSYAIYITATVNSVVGGQTFNFKVDVADVNVVSLANNVITAAVIADAAIDRATFAADTGLQSVRSGTAQAGGGSTITLDASASAVDSFYRRSWVYITGGTGVGQVRNVSGYVGATKVVTTERAWSTNPDNTSTFAILPFSLAGADVVLWAGTQVASPTVAGVPAVEVIDMSAAGQTDVRAAVGLATANLDTQLADLPTNAELATALGTLNNLSAAQVNAEVLDVLTVDTFAEPGQGAPAATTTILGRLQYLYKFLRNKVTQTSTTFSVFDDAGSTVDQKATVSDDGTTFTRTEIASGP